MSGTFFRTIFLTFFFILGGYILFLLAPTSFSDEQIRFVVPLNPNQNNVIAELKKQNFIRSKSAFRFISGIFKFPGIIEPGAYLLSHRMNLIELTNTLLFHPSYKWIVLVPGLRREQIAERLKAKFLWSEEMITEFLGVAKEGYLFPDTYLIPVDEKGASVAKRLMSRFDEKFDAKMQKDLQAQNVRLDTAVKIASLIERESGSSEDKALISGIIWNRLLLPMKLQIDATSQYIKGKPGDWWPVVTPDDHKVNSPYNTYIYKGLPPTAIANPSLASLAAAVYPEETECLFYIHDQTKQIHCAKTYAKHLENIETYLR